MEEIFKIFGVEWKLLLVNIFNFAVLLIALTYILYKPVIKLLDERRAKIEKGLKDAELADKRLKEIEKEKEDIIAKAQKEAQDAIVKAQNLAKEERDKIIQEAQAKAISAIALAKRQANEAKNEIMQEAKDAIAKDAVLAAKKILSAN
jgi:F-type H+-transporting ATPase subunit b